MHGNSTTGLGVSRIEDHPGNRHLKPVVSVSVENDDKLVRGAPPKGVDPHLVSFLAPDSPEAEQYRALRYAVEYGHDDGESTVVGVCSPLPVDGKSLTAINLAGAL